MNTLFNTDPKRDLRKFEFTLFLNENIIVQRFFNINGFNEKAINSMNFKETIDDIRDVIEDHMKDKTLDFMNENSRSFYENPNYEQNDAIDIMKIIVKSNDDIIANRQWDATIYPLKIRYTVDIREYIYSIINQIQKCLSERNDRLETTYMNYSLIK